MPARLELELESGALFESAAGSSGLRTGSVSTVGIGTRGRLASSSSPLKDRSLTAGAEFEGSTGTELVSVGKELISGLGAIFWVGLFWAGLVWADPGGLAGVCARRRGPDARQHAKTSVMVKLDFTFPSLRVLGLPFGAGRPSKRRINEMFAACAAPMGLNDSSSSLSPR